MEVLYTLGLQENKLVAAMCVRLSMICAPVRRNNPRALARGLSTVQAHKPCSISRTMISSVDLAHYGVSRAKYWVSVDCGTSLDELPAVELAVSKNYCFC